MPTYSEILKKYIGAAGKLTRFKGDYNRFRVAFNIEDPQLVKDMRKKGAELFTLVEVGEDYVSFQSANSKIYLPLNTIVLED
jgi:hypothetical protein